MSDKVGQDLVAMLTASIHRDGDSLNQIWQEMSHRAQGEAVALLLGFLEAETDLAAHLMGANPVEYRSFMLRRMGERFASDA